MFRTTSSKIWRTLIINTNKTPVFYTIHAPFELILKSHNIIPQHIIFTHRILCSHGLAKKATGYVLAIIDSFLNLYQIFTEYNFESVLKWSPSNMQNIVCCHNKTQRERELALKQMRVQWWVSILLINQINQAFLSSSVRENLKHLCYFDVSLWYFVGN